jgi:hypothetical protein
MTNYDVRATTSVYGSFEEAATRRLQRQQHCVAMGESPSRLAYVRWIFVARQSLRILAAARGDATRDFAVLMAISTGMRLARVGLFQKMPGPTAVARSRAGASAGKKGPGLHPTFVLALMHRAALVVPVVLWSAISLAAQAPAWQVSQGEVRVICPMTIGGSFEAKTSSLTGNVSAAAPSPSLAGEFSVDLTTLDTGIDLRNDHLRRNYLEVGKGEGFDRAVLSDIDLGSANPETFQGRTRFTGTLLLHGTTRMVAGVVEISRTRVAVRVSARFPLALSDYRIKKPRYLGIGVSDRIEVTVTFVATPVTGSASGAFDRERDIWHGRLSTVGAP